MNRTKVLVAVFLAALACVGAVCSEDVKPGATIALLNGILDEEAELYASMVQEHSRNAPIENQNWEPFSTAVVLWDESFSKIPAQLSALATQLGQASQETRNAAAEDLRALSVRMNLLLARPVSLQFLTEPWTELYLRKASLNVAVKLYEITGSFSSVFGQPPAVQPIWHVMVVQDTKPPKTALVSRAWKVLKGSLAQCSDPLVPCSVGNNERFAIDALTPDASGYLHYEGQTFGINLGTISQPEYSVTFRRMPGSSIQGPIRYGEPIAVIFEDQEGNSIGSLHAIKYASSTDGSVDLGFTSPTNLIAFQWKLVPVWSYLSDRGVFDSRITFGLKNISRQSNPFLTRCYASSSVGVDLGWFLISPTEINSFSCDD